MQKMLSTTPFLLELNTIGNPSIGNIVVSSKDYQIPFNVKNVYWIIGTPEGTIRGNHAHKNLFQVIFCLTGSLNITLIDQKNKLYNFTLNQPNIGLFIPKLFWREIEYKNKSTLLCLASEPYSHLDYIRTFNDFIIYNEQ